MKIDILPLAGKLHVARLSNVTAVVVDVLRATTNMILCVQNGAIRVIPTSDAAEAASFISRIGGRDNILAGETGGLKTPGFDLGNSPFEFGPEVVGGRSVVMSTTNGTGAVCAAAAADKVLIGAMINAGAVAGEACRLGRDVLFVCAGTDGMISSEDLLCAGAIAERIVGMCKTAEQTDIVRLCRWLYRDYAEGRIDMAETFHYSRLVQMGFEKDVELCMKEDVTDTVPVYENGVVIKP